jgi:hypothetical protein
MSDLTAADRLAHVARSLARHLPDQLPTLLAAPRFEDGRAALTRLAAPGGAAGAVAGLRPAEAARLADVLIERWAAVAEVVIDPGAVVVGPDEVWVSGQPRVVQYDIATIAMEDGWTAEWSTGSPAVEFPVPRDGEEVELVLTVRVFGRAQGRRQVVVGERTVRVRRPVAHLEPGGSRLVVADHLGRPASGVDMSVDSTFHHTDREGVVQFPEATPADAVVLVDGQPAAWAP